MGFYRLIESRVRGPRDYMRLDPVKASLSRALSAAAARCPRGRWLDVGAGSGQHRELFAAYAGSYVAVDPSPRGPGILRGVGEALPVRSGAFDTVVLSEVLEHVRDPRRVLLEAVRALRPGGEALVSVPFVFYEHESPRDFQRFTRHGLRQLLEDAGLTVLELEPVCGLVATLGIPRSMAWLGTVGAVPGLWGAALTLNDWWMRAVELPLDRALDPGKRWAQGHWARARKS